MSFTDEQVSRRNEASRRVRELSGITGSRACDLKLLGGNRHILEITDNDIRAAKRWAASNALSGDDITKGGGLLETQMATEIIAIALGEASKMRQVAKVVPAATINQDYAFIQDNETEGIQYESGEATTEVDPVFEGRQSFGVKYGSDVVVAPNELVRDLPWTVVAILQVLARRIARRQNRAFTVGSGANEPMGLASGCTVGKTTAVNNAIAINEVFDLIGSVDSEYGDNPSEPAALMMNPLIHAYMQKLTDTNGTNLWKLSGLSDYPIHLNSHMPSSITAGAPVMLYGQYSRAYTIREFPVRFNTLSEMYAETYSTGFEVLQTVDGFITDYNGVKSLVVHA